MVVLFREKTMEKWYAMLLKYIVECSKEEEVVEPWIIIVSILGGLMLIAIIVLIIIRITIELRVSLFVMTLKYMPMYFILVLCGV